MRFQARLPHTADANVAASSKRKILRRQTSSRMKLPLRLARILFATYGSLRAAGVHELTVPYCYYRASPAMQKIIRFLRSEDGPTAVEYGVMLALIFLVCIAAITLVGQQTSSSFTSSNNAIGNALGS